MSKVNPTVKKESTIEVGDIVTLRPDSQWARGFGPDGTVSNPLGMEGKVTRALKGNDMFTIGVNWKNGYSNSYGRKDLNIIKKAKMKSQTTKKAISAKKVATVKRTPFTDYEGWTIHRTPTSVSFGCGAVRVSKKDLVAVAGALENPEVVKAVKAFANLLKGAGTRKTLKDLLKITPQTYLRIAGK
jgi:hypothetical protein